MGADQTPFADVVVFPDGLSLPDLKWRELVFVGAMRPSGEGWVRDPAREMPPFEREGLFPEGVLFSATREGGRMRLRRLGPV